MEQEVFWSPDRRLYTYPGASLETLWGSSRWDILAGASGTRGSTPSWEGRGAGKASQVPWLAGAQACEAKIEPPTLGAQLLPLRSRWSL